MATNLDSATVTGGDDALATQYNNARKDLIKNAGDYEVGAGTGDVITLAIDAQYVAYAAGDVIKFQASAVNTGAVTINVNSLGAKSIKKNHNVALEAGDIESGMEVVIQYDGTNFQLQTPHASQMSTANSDTLTDTSNADSLHVHEYSKRLIVIAAAAVTGVTAETDLLSVSVPANSLGTGNALHIKLHFETFSIQINHAIRVRVKYGGTTVYDKSFTNGGAAQPDHGQLDAMIIANGATNAQRGVAHVLFHDEQIRFDISGSDVWNAYDEGAAAIDSTSAQDLKVTITPSSTPCNVVATGYAELVTLP